MASAYSRAESIKFLKFLDSMWFLGHDVDAQVTVEVDPHK